MRADTIYVHSHSPKRAAIPTMASQWSSLGGAIFATFLFEDDVLLLFLFTFLFAVQVLAFETCGLLFIGLLIVFVCSSMKRAIQAHSKVQNILPVASAVPAPHRAPSRWDRAQWLQKKMGVIGRFCGDVAADAMEQRIH